MAEPKILLISNNEEISSLLKNELVANCGYSLFIADSVNAGMEIYKSNSFDLVMFMFDMSYLNPDSLVRDLKKIDPEVIIIALIKNDSPNVLREISRLVIYDFLLWPVNLEKLTFLVKKGAELHSLTIMNRKLSESLREQNASLQKQNVLLAKRVEDSTENLTRLYEDLRSTYMRTIKALAEAIDARDHYTHSHSQNVSKYAVAVAEEMHLSARDIELIREACELHDLGKIGIRDDILTKPSSLDVAEWELMKQHPLTGAKILEPLTFLHGVIELIRQHHEHFDGTGYPEKLKGEEILLGARIIHLADAYEAMTSARSYRKTPLSKDGALAEIKKNNGTQFDPEVVRAFLKIIDKI